MGITNLYPNLPGHLVEFKDGGLQLTDGPEESGYDKSILILGTAFDGPINEPVRIDKKTVVQLYGSDVNEKGFPNGATLTKYAKQAFKNGFSDVRCMRISGSEAYVDIEKSKEKIETEYEADPISIVAEGTANTALPALSNLPVIEDSLVVTDGTKNVGYTVAPYTGIVTINGDVSKNANMECTYNYMDINTTENTKEYTGEEDDENPGEYLPLQQITLDFDASTDFIYVTPKSGDEYIENAPVETDGLKIENLADNTVLVKGTDYTVAGNLVTFATTVTNVAVSFYTYKVLEASESFQLEDEDQVVELPNYPVEGSVVVTENGAKKKEGEDYTVAVDELTETKKITLIAGQFNVNSEVNIEYSYKEVEEIKEGMTVKAKYGGSAYKKAKITITPMNDEEGNFLRTKFTFTKPSEKVYGEGDKPFYFTSEECPTVGDLKMALDNYQLNNVFEIVCDDENMSTEDFPAFSSELVNGGEDGVVLDNNALFEALSGKRDEEGYLIQQGAYQILENYNVDYIYPAGVYADSKQTVSKNSDFHHELALLCAVLTYRTKMTHGFIDVRPNSNTTLIGIQKHVDKLAAMQNLHYMRDNDGNDIVDSEGNKMDIGWYTSLVVGPEPVMISDTLGTYYGSPAIAYAALCASLKPQSSPTNKALPGVRGMKYKLSNKQMDILVGNRMVVFKLKNEGVTTATSVPYVVDGCTAGGPNCDYARMSTVKIVTDVVDQIREVADPFIGEPNTVEQRNALAALISKRLSFLLEQGEIQHYEFEINATIQQVLIGECTIALTLVCPMELRRITTVVALRAAA